jgi:hypothetical protein
MAKYYCPTKNAMQEWLELKSRDLQLNKMFIVDIMTSNIQEISFL